MTDKKDFDDDGSYVLEDTGESLEDFESRVTAGEDQGQSNSPGQTVDLANLRAENEKLRDQYVRKLADFDNFRKRTDREKQDFYRYALTDILREVLPVLDNFERALAAGADGGEEFRRGVDLIYRQLADVLRKNGLTVIDESAVTFDPQIHEAVIREENDAVPNHTVTEVLQKGYYLNDRLLRPAMVKVAVGGPEDSEAVQG
ncbi:MAG: nucleotide exchange factor GrpE [Acidobacteriota bacterium]